MWYVVWYRSMQYEMHTMSKYALLYAIWHDAMCNISYAVGNIALWHAICNMARSIQYHMQYATWYAVCNSMISNMTCNMICSMISNIMCNMICNVRYGMLGEIRSAIYATQVRKRRQYSTFTYLPGRCDMICNMQYGKTSNLIIHIADIPYTAIALVDIVS